MTITKIQFIAGLLITVALLFAGVFLVVNNASPATIHGNSSEAALLAPTQTTKTTNVGPTNTRSQPSEPTLIPPDLTVAAEIMAIPTCCDQSIPTPTFSPEIIGSVTQEAKKRLTLTFLPGEPTYAPGNYVAPSDIWVIYADRKFGLSFSYPDNFTVVPYQPSTGDIRVLNRPFNDGRIYDANSKERFSVVFKPPQTKNLETPLLEYVASIQGSLYDQYPPQDISLNGRYAGIQQQFPTMGDRITTVIYLEKGELVYQITFLDTMYQSTIDKLLNSLMLP